MGIRDTKKQFVLKQFLFMLIKIITRRKSLLNQPIYFEISSKIVAINRIEEMETVEVSAIESVVYFYGDEVVPCKCRLTSNIKIQDKECYN